MATRALDALRDAPGSSLVRLRAIGTHQSPIRIKACGTVRKASARSPWLIRAPENLWYPAVSNCRWAGVLSPNPDRSLAATAKAVPNPWWLATEAYPSSISTPRWALPCRTAPVGKGAPFLLVRPERRSAPRCTVHNSSPNPYGTVHRLSNGRGGVRSEQWFKPNPKNGSPPQPWIIQSPIRRLSSHRTSHPRS